MKKIISLVLSLMLVLGIVVLASCGVNETTQEVTTVEDTTVAVTTEATTTTEETTTTTETTTEATTTTEETTTTTEEVTTVEETTLMPIFARFDFGTKTYAEDNGLTSHQYLVDNLTYNKDNLSIEFKEDSWVIKAKVSGQTCSVAFNNMITYDFDDWMEAGWGSWSQYPYTDKNVGTTWQGHHQYMKIRLINHSLNNMIGFRWASSGHPYATTMVVSNMYLQDGVGKKTASTISNDYATYTYDIMFLTCLASNKADGQTSYSGFEKYVQEKGGVPGNNWMWQNGVEITGLEFHLLGAYSANNSGICDSRANIKSGNWVEVDYIVFGGSPEQLDTYKSYLELNA